MPDAHQEDEAVKLLAITLIGLPIISIHGHIFDAPGLTILGWFAWINLMGCIAVKRLSREEP